MGKKRVLIVDDHPIIRDGMISLFADHPHIDIVGVANDGMEGITLLKQLNPDCVVLDLAMPKLGGAEAVRLCRQKFPDLGIVVFTGHNNETLLNEVLKAGAQAYVLKGSTFTDLADAIMEVCRGGYWISPELNVLIIKQYINSQKKANASTTGYESLSEREKQVFILLASGKSQREVGEELFISSKTVSKHAVAIKKKLGIKNTAQMTNIAIKLGLGPSLIT